MGEAIDKGIYRFPVFTEGTIVFRNGGTIKAKLNYNITMDEMHFISPKGDTMAVGDPPVISYIEISPRRFYYEKGYLQTIAVSNDIILAFKQVVLEDHSKKGAFGIATEHPSAISYSLFTVKGQQYNLGSSEELSTRESYFFGDSFGHFSKASKEYILLHYNKKEEPIKEFIKTNHTNFTKEEDLLKLLQYCEQLP